MIRITVIITEYKEHNEYYDNNPKPFSTKTISVTKTTTSTTVTKTISKEHKNPLPSLYYILVNNKEVDRTPRNLKNMDMF